jgi:hypothetical protein
VTGHDAPFPQYRYILDFLIQHGKFELLLGKDVMLDDQEGRVELKMALRDYLIRRWRRPTFTFFCSNGPTRLGPLGSS